MKVHLSQLGSMAKRTYFVRYMFAECGVYSTNTKVASTFDGVTCGNCKRTERYKRWLKRKK